jgi:PAS domain S-box-containing protein
VTAASARPVVVPEAVADQRVRHLPPVTSGMVGSYLGVPLRATRGEVVGALCAFDRESRAWGDREVVVLELHAGAVAAELERAALAREHATTLLRLELALAAAGVGSWDWDLVGGELSWDDRLRTLFGYTESEFDGTQDAFERRIHREDLPRVVAALEAAARGEAEFDEVYRVVLPDTTVRWVSGRGRALTDEGGRVARVVGAATDVSERQLAERASADSLALLELVAEASRVLADSLEPEHAVRNLAQLLVPALADWSIVTLVQQDGRLHDVESWHRDPAMRPVVARLAGNRLEGHRYVGALGDVMITHEAVFIGSGGGDRAERVLRSQVALEAVRQLRHESLAVFPLLVDDRVVGMLTVARGPERPALAGAEAATVAEIAERASTALDHARSFGRVRDFSEQLQRTMLEDPVETEGLDIAVLYTPASQAARVGGDWYDSFVHPDGSTMLVVGDVIGHDSAAAAAMGQLRSVTRGIAHSTGGTPAGVLASVDRAIDGLGMDTIATVVAVQLRAQPDGSTLMTWSNGGHPPPAVLHPDGTSELLEGHDLLLGLLDDDPRIDREVVLLPGSVVLLFTDGLVERRGENIAVGLERLRSVAEAGCDLPPVDLVRHVHREMVPSEPDDDVAVLAVAVS